AEAVGYREAVRAKIAPKKRRWGYKKVSSRPSEARAGTTAELGGCSPQKHELGVVIDAALQFFEAIGSLEGCGLGFLDDQQRACSDPPAVAQRAQRPLRQSLAIGRIGEDEREWFDRMRGTEIGRVAAIDLGDAAEPERFDVVAQQCTGLGAVVDEQRESR